MFGPSAAVLYELGAKDTDLIVRGNEPWRLLTAMWLHAGLIHLATNMYGLLQVIGQVCAQHTSPWYCHLRPRWALAAALGAGRLSS
eukprot:SAG31_NODE_4449_length_3222_cov_1.382325_2_plen_86_part_00